MENTEITVSMKTAMAEHQHICECYRTCLLYTSDAADD